MANLYSSLTQSASQPNPSEQWVYASDQYKIYEITPSAVPDTRAKWDRVGHTIMNSINPDYVMIRSFDGIILMVVGNSRWDAASLKQTMDRECFQATAGDVTYTVESSTGYFAGRDDGATDLTLDGNDDNPLIDQNFSHWRNFPDVMQVDGGVAIMNYNRTQSTNPGAIEATWDDEVGERDLINEAAKATNYNLGNYFDGTGRYNEFPLDLAITNGGNLRMYQIDIDEIDVGDGTGSTTSITTGTTGQPGRQTDNIYDRNGFFSVFIGACNPLMYTFSRYNDIADGNDGSDRNNRLVFFLEQDKFAPGGEFGMSSQIAGAGGDLENDGNAFDNDVGMIVAPVRFTRS